MLIDKTTFGYEKKSAAKINVDSSLKESYLHKDFTIIWIETRVSILTILNKWITGSEIWE